jgi:hypothetical protein
MEKPSIVSAFEQAFNKNKNIIHILIDARSVVSSDIHWLPGAEDSLDLIADREDCQVTIYTADLTEHNVEDLTKLLKRARLMFSLQNDPLYLNSYDILLSNKAGFVYTDFPAIKDYLSKL